MADEITIVPDEARALDNWTPVKIQAPAGVSGNVGDLVYLDSNGNALLAICTTVGPAQAAGIVTMVGQGHSSAFNSGDMLEIVTHGPVNVGSSASMTIGKNNSIYTSGITAGGMTQTAPAVSGDFPFKIGWAMRANVVYVATSTVTPVVVV